MSRPFADIVAEVADAGSMTAAAHRLGAAFGEVLANPRGGLREVETAVGAGAVEVCASVSSINVPPCRVAITIIAWAAAFTWSGTDIAWAVMVYGFLASVLPVWLLLSPRGYLSSFTKIGTIFLLAIGVIIGHSQRLQTWYWHMSRETVSVGQQVSTGDLLGFEGATGLATGCHLHFEVLFDGKPVNPRGYLP